MGLSRMGMGTSRVSMGIKYWYLGHGCLIAYSVFVSSGDGAVCRLSECFLSFLLLLFYLDIYKTLKSARMWKSIHKLDSSVILSSPSSSLPKLCLCLVLKMLVTAW